MPSLIDQRRIALRSLCKRPGFAVLAILILALGIGLTTAVYAVFRQVLLRELPVRNPDELVLLEHTGSDTGSLNAYGGTSPQFFSATAFHALRTAYPQLTAAALSTAATLMLSAFLAALLPTLRAARVEPMQALRTE